MFLQIKGKGNYLLVFGGEVDPSSKGHEGAGGFANDVILIDEDSLKVEVMSHARSDDMEIPLERGWSTGDLLYNNGSNRLVIFGGLSGNDDSPMRLNDLWICEVKNT